MSSCTIRSETFFIYPESKCHKVVSIFPFVYVIIGSLLLEIYVFLFWVACVAPCLGVVREKTMNPFRPAVKLAPLLSVIGALILIGGLLVMQVVKDQVTPAVSANPASVPAPSVLPLRPSPDVPITGTFRLEEGMWHGTAVIDSDGTVHLSNVPAQGACTCSYVGSAQGMSTYKMHLNGIDLYWDVSKTGNPSVLEVRVRDGITGALKVTDLMTRIQ
jgi:hypothetical protein